MMKYPAATDYHAIIQNPRVAFHDPELQACEVEKSLLGTPIVYSGGFALTYFLKGKSGKSWVVRCFKSEQVDRQRRYEAISQFLATNHNGVFVGAAHQKTGIQVSGQWYPIVKMPRVTGETLHKYIERCLANGRDVSELHMKFRGVIDTLRSLGVAHGDLQHGNIMVSGNNLVLIDYDGMYVPALKGLPSAESGHESYQHPDRKQYDTFGADLDNFSSIVIYIALRALALKPSLWQRYSNGDNVLFRSSDFQAPEQSSLLAELEQLAPIHPLIANLRNICRAPFHQIPTLDSFVAGKNIPQISTPSRSVAASPPTSQYPLLDATDIPSLLAQLGNKITLIGCIVDAYQGKTESGAPYVFLNFGDWRQGASRLVLWADALKLCKQQKLDPLAYAGRWVSVTGLLTSYTKLGRLTQPQIVIDLPSGIEILAGGEVEASARLNSSAIPPRNNVYPLPSAPGTVAPTSPTIVATPTEEKIAGLYGGTLGRKATTQASAPPRTLSVPTPPAPSRNIAPAPPTTKPAKRNGLSSPAFWVIIGIIVILAWLIMGNLPSSSESGPQQPGRTSAPPAQQSPPELTSSPNASIGDQLAYSRTGPGATYPIAGRLVPHQKITLIARSADGGWFQLKSGHWVNASSVVHPPAELLLADLDAQITPAPAPRGLAAFSPLTFCYEADFSQLAKKCTKSTTVFTGVVERLFVSWTPSQQHKGSEYLKQWYLDGNLFLESESTNEWAYVEVATRPSLKPGQYTVEVYVSEKLVQTGRFTIH